MYDVLYHVNQQIDRVGALINPLAEQVSNLVIMIRETRTHPGLIGNTTIQGTCSRIKKAVKDVNLLLTQCIELLNRFTSMVDTDDVDEQGLNQFLHELWGMEWKLTRAQKKMHRGGLLYEEALAGNMGDAQVPS
jgi:hypothetical protein